MNNLLVGVAGRWSRPQQLATRRTQVAGGSPVAAIGGGCSLAGWSRPMTQVAHLLDGVAHWIRVTDLRELGGREGKLARCAGSRL
ncbi:hypothetical protein R6Q59_028619 [Mikania micrantha]